MGDIVHENCNNIYCHSFVLLFFNVRQRNYKKQNKSTMPVSKITLIVTNLKKHFLAARRLFQHGMEIKKKSVDWRISEEMSSNQFSNTKLLLLHETNGRNNS